MPDEGRTTLEMQLSLRISGVQPIRFKTRRLRGLYKTSSRPLFYLHLAIQTTVSGFHRLIDSGIGTMGTLLLVLQWFTVTQASIPGGDPTNVIAYPICIQTCIPPSFGPPASCGSLSNRTCICQNPLFAQSVAVCALPKCSKDEVTVLNRLFTSLCASSGGVDAILSAEERVFATASLDIPETPTYHPDVTGINQASAILATATPAPNLGNPASGISPEVFPPCVLFCAKVTVGLITTPNSLAQVCGFDFRLQNAICKTALCNSADRQISNLLAQQLCGPYYRNNPLLGSSVSSAFASVTPVVQAAIASRNLSSGADYPECAKNCFTVTPTETDPCGAFIKGESILDNVTARHDLMACQDAVCEGDDAIRAATSAYLLCAQTNGTAFSTNGTTANQTATLGLVPSTTVLNPFTGEAGHFASWTWMLALLMATMAVLL